MVVILQFVIYLSVMFSVGRCCHKVRNHRQTLIFSIDTMIIEYEKTRVKKIALFEKVQCSEKMEKK